MNNAGHINRDWYDHACLNASDAILCEWIKAARNSTEVEIDSNLAVWADGQWLTQDQIDQVVKTIDAGV